MAIDQQLIGQAAAQIMEDLEQYGPTAEIELVALVVSVGDGAAGQVHYRFSSGGNVRAWQARGLLEQAARNLG